MTYFDEENKSPAWTMKSYECSICFEITKEKAVCSPCKHEFCLECIQTWKNINPICPMCRLPIQDINQNLNEYVINDQATSTNNQLNTSDTHIQNSYCDFSFGSQQPRPRYLPSSSYCPYDYPSPLESQHNYPSFGLTHSYQNIYSRSSQITPQILEPYSHSPTHNSFPTSYQYYNVSSSFTVPSFSPILANSSIQPRPYCSMTFNSSPLSPSPTTSPILVNSSIQPRPYCSMTFNASPLSPSPTTSPILANSSIQPRPYCSMTFNASSLNPSPTTSSNLTNSFSSPEPLNLTTVGREIEVVNISSDSDSDSDCKIIMQCAKANKIIDTIDISSDEDNSELSEEYTHFKSAGFSLPFGEKIDTAFQFDNQPACSSKNADSENSDSEEPYAFSKQDRPPIHKFPLRSSRLEQRGISNSDMAPKRSYSEEMVFKSSKRRKEHIQMFSASFISDTDDSSESPELSTSSTIAPNKRKKQVKRKLVCSSKDQQNKRILSIPKSKTSEMNQSLHFENLPSQSSENNISYLQQPGNNRPTIPILENLDTKLMSSAQEQQLTSIENVNPEILPCFSDPSSDESYEI